MEQIKRQYISRIQEIIKVVVNTQQQLIMALPKQDSTNHLSVFIQKLEKTCCQLLKEIRKYGDDNVSTRFYLEEFKNFQKQLASKQPLRQSMNASILQTLEHSVRFSSSQQHNPEKSPNTLATEETLKPAVKRQLLLIQSQEAKSQQIYDLIHSVEASIQIIPFPDGSTEFNLQNIESKLLPAYHVAQDWLKDVSQIVAGLIALLENHLESFNSSSISFQKSIISPESNQRSALTSILESMNRSDKLKPKSDCTSSRDLLRESRTHKKLQSKFDLVTKPVPTEIKLPKPMPKACGECLLF